MESARIVKMWLKDKELRNENSEQKIWRNLMKYQSHIVLFHDLHLQLLLINLIIILITNQLQLEISRKTSDVKRKTDDF